jgi:hypothetical protein
VTWSPLVRFSFQEERGYASEDHQRAPITNSVVSADPPLIRRVGGELPIEQVRRDWLAVIAHGRALETLLHAGAGRPPASAESRVTADPFVLLEQVPVNPRTPVPALASANDARTSTFN